MNTKIVCVYHSASPQHFSKTMLKYPDIFVPVLGGADSYKSGTSDFFDVTLKDNDGKNISSMNSRYGEHSVLYWMCENYDKLGSPDIIGLCHYRRFLDIDYNNIDPNMVYIRRSIFPYVAHARRAMLTWSGGYSVLGYILDELIYRLPEYADAIAYMLDDYRLYDKTMFIMPKHVFMDYAKYMMTCYSIVLDEAVNDQFTRWYKYKVDPNMDEYFCRRGIGVMMECLSGVYFQQLRFNGVPTTILQATRDSFNGY